jgi:MFS family permease
MAKFTQGMWAAVACILISFFSSIALQASGIFLPLFATDIGASKFQIGVVGGAFGAAYLVSSLVFGRQSDMHGRLPFIRAGLGLTVVSYVLQLFITSPGLLIADRVIMGFSIAMSDAALMAYNFESSGRTGRFVSLAALGWLVGGVTSIFYHNYHGLFILSALGCAVAFAISWTLAKEQNRHTRPAITRTFTKNLRVYLPFLMRNIGGNMVWFIMPLFLVSLGANMSWVAILQCVNTGTQFVVMMFVDRIKGPLLFTLGIFSSGLVFIGYAIARNYVQIVPVQVILAASWSFLYVGALLILFKNSEEKATSASVLLSSGSLSQAVGPFIGGFVVQLWGYQPLMYVAAAFCAAGAVIAQSHLLVPKKIPQAVEAGSK